MGFIYKILNNVNGKMYIGQTSRTIEERYAEHLNHARNHENRYLYDAMNKYGYDKFTISVIEEVQDADLDAKEIYYIALYKTLDKNFGYNMNEGGNGCHNLTEESEAIRSAKISKSLSGRKQPKELVEKRAKKLRGKKRSKEFCEKMSQINKGRQAWNKGKACAESTKQKLRQANTGKKQSDETKAKRKDSIHKLKWFNNGIENIRALICPEGFVPGRINFNPSAAAKAKSSHKGTHWYTNGIKNIMAYECPDGFWPGKTKLDND